MPEQSPALLLAGMLGAAVVRAAPSSAGLHTPPDGRAGAAARAVRPAAGPDPGGPVGHPPPGHRCPQPPHQVGVAGPYLAQVCLWQGGGAVLTDALRPSSMFPIQRP